MGKKNRKPDSSGQATGDAKASPTTPSLPSITGANDDRIDGLIFKASLVAIFAIVIALALLGGQFEVEYWDSYESLLNARMCAQGVDMGYRPFRAPGAALVFVPIFLLERMGFSVAFASSMVHVTGALFFGLFLFGVYKLCRLTASPVTSAIATFASATCPWLVNYAPMGKEDIPASALLTIAIYLYLQSRIKPSRKAQLAAGLMLGLSMSMRYNLFVMVLPIVLGFEVLSGSFRNNLRQKVIDLLILPGFVLLAVTTLVYVPMGHATLFTVPRQLKTDMRETMNVFANYAWESSWWPYRFVFESITPVTCVLAIAGIGLFLYMRRGDDSPETRQRCMVGWFGLFWLASFFLFMTYAVKQKEARYGFIYYPPIYFFLAVTLAWVWRWTKTLSSQSTRDAVKVLTALLVLAWPAWQTRRCFVRFTDPIYHYNLHQESSLAAVEMAGESPIVWYGSFYPVFPADYLFDRDDKYTAIYHHSSHVIEYFTGRKVLHLQTKIAPNLAVDNLLTANPMLAGLATQRIVVVASVQPDMRTDSAMQRERILPLIIQELIPLPFTSADAPGANLARFTEPKSGASIEVRFEETDGHPRTIIDGHHLPNGNCVLYAAKADGTPAILSTLTIKDGRFHIDSPRKYEAIASLRVVSQGKLRLFKMPTRDDPSVETDVDTVADRLSRLAPP